ncbi:hypothetical protein [Nocardia sp. BMG51109]|uniref:hypothetical protein n=1 Tax=Nocardia sp. BMG51109 TaxID=1056816 RepID=UPI000465F44A|nr:hypothetical protein [Nocardia sp. BMG51109]
MTINVTHDALPVNDQAFVSTTTRREFSADDLSRLLGGEVYAFRVRDLHRVAWLPLRFQKRKSAI